MRRVVAKASAVVLAAAVLVACRGGPRIEIKGEGPEARADALKSVETDIASRYPDVEHLEPAALKERMDGAARTVVLDVREEDEYRVARIPGAIRVSPAASADEVKAAIGGLAGDSEVVFYCSVGERSSKLATRSEKALLAAGAKAVYNLRGGIFAWHNGGRPLIDDGGPTTSVHPYNDKWGQLLIHRDQIATSPK